MKILKIPVYALIYLSIVTILAEAGGLVVCWAKGNLTEESMLQVMAVARDVDLSTLRRRQERTRMLAPPDDVSMEEVENARTAAALDLTMREMAIDKGLIDILEISEQFNLQWEEYKKVKDGFDQEFEKLRKGATDEGVKDVQRQLESLSPKLAKVQILKIMDASSRSQEAALQFVVAVIKGMPMRNRKRIIEEFRDEDSERLHEILRQIRKGEPDLSLFRETREKLKDFD